MQANGSGQQVITNTGDVRLFEWSPDGSMAALIAGTVEVPRLRVVRADGSQVFEREGVGSAVWSPSGDRLLVEERGRVVVLDAAGGEVRSVEGAARPVWAPDGNRIAVLKETGGRWRPLIIDLASGAETELAPGLEPSQEQYPIAWHPAGQVIGYRNVLYDLGNGVTVEIPGVAVGWNPDGRMLMVSGSPAPGEGTNGLLLDATQNFKQVIGFYIRQSEQGVPPWWFISEWTAWTPDGRFLLYLDPELNRNRLRIYDTVAITQRRYPDIAGRYPDVAPDGRTASFIFEGKVWVFPLDASTLVAPVEGAWARWRPESGE
jgi:dipeptidyl aminopeptidase/acylaminoacyl peptidase